MTIQGDSATQQGAQSTTPAKDSKQKVMEIREERNRLVRSVMQQPTDVLRDIAVLAVGWAMHELEFNEWQHQAPSDLLSWTYRFRITGLADGEYGNGAMVKATDDGPQAFDTSTCTLVAQLRKYAGIEVGQ